MIIVVAQRVPYPPNKGEKLRTFHHIKHLVEEGHNVKVYSLRHERSDDALAFELARELNIKVELFSMHNRLWRYSIALLSGKPISVGAFYSSSLKKRLADESQAQPLQVLLSASSLAPYVLNNSAFDRSNAKLLMDFMDVDSDKWSQYANNASGAMRWLYQRESRGIQTLERQINETFDHCFLIADAEISLFEQQVSDTKPITKLNNGMDFDAFHPGQADEKSPYPTFLFTGVMDYKPNVDAVLWFYQHCWPVIKQALPQAKFVVAGMNPSAVITALDKDEDIDITGFVDEILPYYHMAWVFVAPFRLARGVQNKVLQASACALPIVTTQMGAEGIAYANAASMYIENDAQAFSQACIAAIEDKTTADSKALKVHQAITESYSWKRQLQPLSEAVAS